MRRLTWLMFFTTGMLAGCQHGAMQHREPVNVDQAMNATLDSLVDREVIVAGRVDGNSKVRGLQVVSEHNKFFVYVYEFRDSLVNSIHGLEGMHFTVRGILKKAAADQRPLPNSDEPFTPIGISANHFLRLPEHYYLVDAVILDVRPDEEAESLEPFQETDE